MAARAPDSRTMVRMALYLWGMANGPTFVFIYILLQGDEPEYQLNTRRSHNNLQDTEAGKEETMGEQTRYGQSYTFYIAYLAEHHM